MICFGSRLDLYLPREIRLQVAVGDRVSAGSSVLGTFESLPSGS
jgi:phosphatidylserine decarboxylase